MADVALPISAVADLVARDGAAVRVTVAAARGSVPRETGAGMIVGRDAIAGTIGGGHLEFEAIRIARAALAQSPVPAAAWVVRFPLAARLGQCCGGVVTLAFESHAAGRDAALEAAVVAEQSALAFVLVSMLGAPGRLAVTAQGVSGSLGTATLDAAALAHARARLGEATGAALVDVGGVPLLLHVRRPAAFDVVVFGNGHVGRALVTILAAVPARVRWIDAREDDFPAALPSGVEVRATDAPEAEITDAPRGACVVIATHDHALDFALVSAALARADWTYLGLIGSVSKRQQFERKLLARGTARAALARLVCPIGRSAAPALRGKAPGVIALAVAAEIVAVHERAVAAGADAAVVTEHAR